MVNYLHADDAPPPFSNYSQATEAPEGSTLVFVSGQVGVDAEGNLAATEKGQHEQCWHNILAILGAQGLGPQDILEVHGYVTERSGIALYREVRDQMLGGARPASTLLIVLGLAHPDWQVEIAVTAAKPV